MKSVCKLVLLSLFVLISAKDMYGYTITLEPTSQLVWVMYDDGYQEVEAEGYDFAELEGIAPAFMGYEETWIRAGSSSSYGISKTYEDGQIISSAFIDWNQWRQCDPRAIETYHAYYATFLLTITSDFYNTDPIHIYSMASYYIGWANFKIYDDTNNLLYNNEDPDPYFDFWFMPGNTYLLDLTYYFYDNLSNSLDCYNTSHLGFSLVESAPVPEPTTMLLLSAGLIGLAGMRKMFKK